MPRSLGVRGSQRLFNYLMTWLPYGRDYTIRANNYVKSFFIDSKYISYTNPRKMQNKSKQERKDLIQQIKESIHEIATEKQIHSIKSLSVYDPDKVAKLLYLYSTGSSQTRLVRKYGYDRETVISVLADYADHLGKFRELSGRIAAKNYLNLSSLEEDLIEKVRDRMENDPEMEVSFRDLKELSIAKANSAREALTARGEATQITEERKVYTQDEYEATIKAARERIEQAKRIDAEVKDA